jgi:prevent-host-death family protein
MFLVPATILFAALAAASTEPLKTLLSVMGLLMTGLWLARITVWTSLHEIDYRITLSLAGIFTLGWIASTIAHARAWWRQRRMTPTGMRTVNIQEAKTHLSRLVDRAAKGEPFVIAKAGKPMVKVVPLDGTADAGFQRIGFMEGAIAVPDDFDRMGAEEIEKLFGGTN